MKGEWPDWLIVAFFGAILGGIAVGLYGVNLIWGMWVLRRWAAKTNQKILLRQIRHLRRGPFLFSWGYGGGEVVFRIRIERPNGEIVSGWAACSTGMGRRGGRVRTRWDHDRAFPVVPLPSISQNPPSRYDGNRQ